MSAPSRAPIILAMLSRGASWSVIGRKLGLSRQAAVGWARRHIAENLLPPPVSRATWSDAELTALIADHAEGLTFAKISARRGWSRERIAGKVLRLRAEGILPGRPHIGGRNRVTRDHASAAP